MPLMYYNILIHKFLTKEITAEEKVELDNWLNASNDNRQIFEEIKLLWSPDDVNDEMPDPVFQQDLHKLESAIHESVTKDNLIKSYQSTSRIRNIVLLLSLLTAGMVLGWPHLFPPSTQLVTVNNINKHNEILLGDSSHIVLNKNSFLSFSGNPDNRQCVLTGEARFNIKKGDTPFTIKTDSLSIAVKGTSFIVKAYPGTVPIVTVISGTVSVSNNQHNIELTTNEKLTIAENNIINKIPNDNPNFDSWYTNIIRFNNTPLRQVLTLLEDQYDLNFQIHEPKLLSCRFTGTFDHQDVETVLQTIAFSLDLKFIPTDKTHFSVTGPGCLP